MDVNYTVGVLDLGRLEAQLFKLLKKKGSLVMEYNDKGQDYYFFPGVFNIDRKKHLKWMYTGVRRFDDPGGELVLRVEKKALERAAFKTQDFEYRVFYVNSKYMRLGKA